MRNLMIAVLLAGAAASPAFAQDQDNHGHHHDQQNNSQAQSHGDRGQGHGDRGNGGNGGNYRPQQAPQFVRQQQQVQVQEGQRGGWNGGQRFEGRGNVTPQEQVQVQQQAYDHRGYRGGYNGQVQVQEQVRNNYYGQRGTWNGQRGDYAQRQTWQQQQQYRQGTRYTANNWNRNWRNDNRYDWRRYRDSHRSIFHIGVYFDPFGYGYQPFDVGYRLMPAYYGERYWIDPAMYDLPYPPPGTEWVRYWNDAVLVDTYSGQVVDVIRDFFW